MWQNHALIADDIIRDRLAEARAEALYRELLLAPSPLGGPVPGRRRLSVAVLRWVEAVAAAVSRRACATATRLERGAA
jgi:hypothetical protein